MKGIIIQMQEWNRPHSGKQEKHKHKDLLCKQNGTDLHNGEVISEINASSLCNGQRVFLELTILTMVKRLGRGTMWWIMNACTAY